MFIIVTYRTSESKEAFIQENADAVVQMPIIWVHDHLAERDITIAVTP